MIIIPNTDYLKELKMKEVIVDYNSFPISPNFFISLFYVILILKCYTVNIKSEKIVFKINGLFLKNLIIIFMIFTRKLNN